MLSATGRLRPAGRAMLGVLLLLPVLLLPGRRLGAQEPAATLALDEALELARTYNPGLRQARQGIDVAAAAERRGWGAYLPEVRLESGLNAFTNRTLTARNDFGEPVTLENPTDVSATSASGRVSASLTLFDGFGRLNELEAARAGSREAEAFRTVERVRIEAEVRRRFYDALGAQRLLRVERRLLEAAEERLRAMRLMVPAGRATQKDVLGAEVDVARQRMALERALADARTRKLRLQETMGLDERLSFDVVGEFPAPVDADSLAPDRLAETALSSSPRLRRARAAATRAASAADAARSTRWPTLRLSASLDRGVSLPSTDQLMEFPWNRGFGFGAFVSLPVFTGFEASERIARAAAADVGASEDLRAARLAVERAVRTAVAGTRAAVRSVHYAQRAAELSRRRLEMGQEGFRRGVVGFTELQQLIDRAAQSERTAVRARMEYARAVASLEEAVGRPVVPPDGGGQR